MRNVSPCSCEGERICLIQIGAANLSILTKIFGMQFILNLFRGNIFNYQRRAWLVIGELQLLSERISSGWVRYTDRNREYMGSPPYYDLYQGVRSLYSTLPMSIEISVLFVALAQTIKRLYPELPRL